MSTPRPDDLLTAVEMIAKLLRVLPDNGSHPDEDCWGWCWNELNGAAQDEVKAVREEVLTWCRQVQARGTKEAT